MLGKNFPNARCPACLYPLPGFAANFFVPEDGLRCRGTRRSLLAGHVRCGAGIAGASAVAERELPPLAGVTGCHAVPFMRRERPCSVARAPVGENGCPPHGAAPGLRRPAQGGCRAGASVATARTPGAVPLDAGPGQTVLAFGTQMVLVAEVVVALACGIALPLPLGGTEDRTEDEGCRTEPVAAATLVTEDGRGPLSADTCAAKAGAMPKRQRTLSRRRGWRYMTGPRGADRRGRGNLLPY